MVWLGCWSDWVRELRVGSGHSDDWCYHTVDQRRAPTCPSLAFARVDLTSLGGLDDLGLVAVGPGRADRRPRLHGQHPPNVLVFAGTRPIPPSWLQGKSRSNTTRDALGGRSGDRCRRARVAARGGDRFSSPSSWIRRPRANDAAPLVHTVSSRAAANRLSKHGWRAGPAPARAGARRGGDGRDRPGAQERGRRRTTGQCSRDGHPPRPSFVMARGSTCEVAS